MKLIPAKIAHKININSKQNLKYQKFISNFFCDPSNYFNQSCNGEPFCLGKFFTQINDNFQINYILNNQKRVKHEFLLPLMKKKKSSRKKNHMSVSQVPKKEIIYNHEIYLIFDKHENRIKENKIEDSINNKEDKLDDRNLNLLKKQKKNLKSFQKFEKFNRKLENKLVKILKRPKSQLLIFSSTQEKFRIKKEEREDSNNYHKDKCDKMNFQFNRYLRTENNFNEDIQNLKKNKLYIRKPNIPIPNNLKLKNQKTKKNLNGLFIKGENLLKWEKHLIGQMKGTKYIYRNTVKESSSTPNISINSKRTLSLNNSQISNFPNFSLIEENEQLIK